jgi:hypothetical protein|uniref:Uncharacterized protein n=1 Tax=Fagus sylvatica TaxID=28930 RepID=A0A2N9HW77_FAGSY
MTVRVVALTKRKCEDQVVAPLKADGVRRMELGSTMVAELMRKHRDVKGLRLCRMEPSVRKRETTIIGNGEERNQEKDRINSPN